MEHVGWIVGTTRGEVLSKSHEVGKVHPLLHQDHPLAMPAGHENLHGPFPYQVEVAP